MGRVSSKRKAILQAGIDKLKSLPTVDARQWWDAYAGSWYDPTHPEDVSESYPNKALQPHYFDHNSGQGAIVTVTEVSRQYPSETFTLNVDGCEDEGPVGLVTTLNGKVLDGRHTIDGPVDYEWAELENEIHDPHIVAAEREAAEDIKDAIHMAVTEEQAQ